MKQYKKFIKRLYEVIVIIIGLLLIIGLTKIIF